MSSNKRTNDSVGARIREERLYLGLSQEAFAKKLGVHRKSQGNYETGAREPDAAYLGAALRAEVDVVYILTGEREGYWYKSLIHIVELILDELDLTHRDSEFRDLRKLAYEEYLATVRGEETKLSPKADMALLAFIRQSPRLLDSDVLSDVVERLEFVAEARSLQLSPQAKAKAIIHLYREAKSQGALPDLQAIAAMIEV